MVKYEGDSDFYARRWSVEHPVPPEIDGKLMNWIPKPESELFICYHEGWTFEQTHDGVRISGWGREAFLSMGEFSEKKLLLMTKSTESVDLPR